MTLPAEQTRRAVDARGERRTVTVSWRLSGPALKRARADLQLGETDATLHIEVALRQGWAPSSTSAWIESKEGTCPLENLDATGRCVVEGDLLHLELPRLLVATLDTREESPRLLYARTPLLEMLGLAPGTYEPTSSSFRR